MFSVTNKANIPNLSQIGLLSVKLWTFKTKCLMTHIVTLHCDKPIKRSSAPNKRYSWIIFAACITHILTFGLENKCVLRNIPLKSLQNEIFQLSYEWNNNNKFVILMQPQKTIRVVSINLWKLPPLVKKNSYSFAVI